MIKKRIKISLALLLSAALIAAVPFCLTGCGESKSLPDVIARVRTTVVDITAGGKVGSGVIIGGAVAHGDGYDYYYIVTNHHVISGAASFTATLLFTDGKYETHDLYKATLMGSSPTRDIAVLRIMRKEDEKISIAEFTDDSDTVRVGDDVIAIGNACGTYSGTVTKGIISAPPTNKLVTGVGQLNMFQTDAAINNGNSGGGLFDTSGRLIGITNGGNNDAEGINFAIPANDAKSAAESIIATYKEDKDGKFVEYGYVADMQLILRGEEKIYASIDDMTLMNRKKRSSYILAQVKSADSPFYDSWGLGSARALISLELNGVARDVTSLHEVNAVMNNLRAGDTLKITSDKVMRSSSRNDLYLDGRSTVSVTVEKSVYTPPEN